jgi:hypothetical protein
MSDKVQGWVWDSNLLPARKLVLLWLVGRATDNGVADNTADSVIGLYRDDRAQEAPARR